MSKVDPRGVIRGRCRDCPCKNYEVEKVGGVKCKCGHPPGRHEKGGSLLPPPLASVPLYSSAGKIETYPYSKSPSRDVPMDETSNTESDVTRDDCSVDGCNLKVYQDNDRPQLTFTFCSQKCRNKTLCDSRKKLIEECRDLEKKILSLDTPVLKIPSRSSLLKTSSVSPQKVLHSSASATEFDTKSSKNQSLTKKSGASKATGKGKHQTTYVVGIKKKREESLGQIFSTDKCSMGETITGFHIKNRSCKYFKEIHLLDVLTKVDSRVVHAESIDQLGVGSNHLQLEIYRPISLPDISTLLLDAHHSVPFSHVFAMRSEKEKDFGIGVKYLEQWKGVGIVNVTTDSIGFRSGLKFEDIVQVCIIVDHSKNEVAPFTKSNMNSEEYEKEVTRTLKTASYQDNNIVLLIINRI